MRKIITAIILLILFNGVSFFTTIKCAGYSFKRTIKEFWGILLFGNLAIQAGVIFLV